MSSSSLSSSRPQDDDHDPAPRLVHFRFEGGVEENNADPTSSVVDVSFPREALKAFPNSVLTKLADDAWNKKKKTRTCRRQEEEAGETSNNPLITKPLAEGCAIREHWSSPNLAQFIADTYTWKFYHQQDKTKKKNKKRTTRQQQQQQESESEDREELEGDDDDDDEKEDSSCCYRRRRPCLPVGVEIQDALIVLDYYGIDFGIDDLVDMIDLQRLSHEEQIRSKLFLREIPLMQEAKDFVLRYLKENPSRETLFIFVGKTDSMTAINHLKAAHYKRINGPNQFVRLGTCHDYHKHYGWGQDINQRHLFLQQLRDTLPSFEIQYLNMDFTTDSRLNLANPPEEFCWIETENETDEEDNNGWILKRVVLSVKIPGRRTLVVGGTTTTSRRKRTRLS